MQVVILAGGLGTRLRPYTVALPKPLVPVGERPIVDILLRQLKAAGATRALVSTGHLSGIVRAYLGDGARYGLAIEYLEEDHPLGTAGPLAFMKEPEENFLVVNGDVLTTLDFRAFLDGHAAGGAAATIGLCRRESRVDFGVVEIAADGALSAYKEKPTETILVSMGVNAFHRKALKHLKAGESIGMPDFFLRLKAAGERVRGRVAEAEWLDIGRPDDYELANKRMAESSKAYLPE